MWHRLRKARRGGWLVQDVKLMSAGVGDRDVGIKERMRIGCLWVLIRCLLMTMKMLLRVRKRLLPVFQILLCGM